MQEVMVFCLTMFWLVCDKSEPVIRRGRAVLEDDADCEALIRALCLFWEMVAEPYLPKEIINYQNAVLAYQIRTHKTSHVRMILQHKETLELHLDVVVFFDYRCSSTCNEAQEQKKVDAVFEKCKDLKYEIGELVPSHVYENNRITLNKRFSSRIEKVEDITQLSDDESVILLELKRLKIK